jgi:hypothetical protein
VGTKPIVELKVFIDFKWSKALFPLKICMVVLLKLTANIIY